MTIPPQHIPDNLAGRDALTCIPIDYMCNRMRGPTVGSSACSGGTVTPRNDTLVIALYRTNAPDQQACQLEKTIP